MLRMIVADMDGTLLYGREEITPANIRALRRAMSRGTKLCIATGRNYTNVQSILSRYDLQACGIYGNGAQLIDEEGTIIATRYFPKEKLRSVLDVFDGEGIDYMIFASQDHFYTTGDPAQVNMNFHIRCATRFHRDLAALLKDETFCVHAKQLVYKSYEDLMADDVDIIKVEAFSLDLEKISRAKKQLAQLTDIAYLSSFDDNIEVTHEQAQKGLILKTLLKQRGIRAEEVIVLGDGMNDISLFEHFPYSYAPANAVSGIKEKAYRVVSAHDEADIADAIEDDIRRIIREKQAFIFDMDGLLIDSERLHLTFWQEAFRALGMPVSEDFMYDLIGSSGKEARRLIAVKTGNPDFLEAARRLRVQKELDYLACHTMPLKTGARELLEYLRQHNIRVILASSSIKSDVMRSLKSAGIDDLMTERICGDDIENAKPQPDIYLKVLERYHLDRHDCLVLEDSINGITAASRAQIDVVGIRDIVALDDVALTHMLGVYDSLLDILEILKNG